MPIVTIERVPAGFTVSCTLRTLPAAQAALNGLLLVTEAAYEPTPQPQVDPAAVKLAIQIEEAEADDPPPHDGRAHPVGPDED